MKNRRLKLFVTSVFLILLVFATYNMICTVKATEPLEPHNANAFWTEPSTKTIDINTANIGDLFNITVWVNVTEASINWQVRILFNTTYFEATRVQYTAGAQSEFYEGLATQPVTPIIENTLGYVQHGEVVMGTGERDPGYGSLMWAEFNLTEIPPENHLAMDFDLSRSFIWDNTMTDILMDTIDGTDIPVIPEFPQIIMLLVVMAASAAFIVSTRKLKL